MLKEAILKIKTEMDKDDKNPYIQVVGQFLLKYLEEDPDSAEHILAEDKTISKSLDEMRKVAEKNRVGNCAVLTDQQGFEVVLGYFGIKDKKVSKELSKNIKAPENNQEGTTGDFDVKLEDLLN